MLYRVQVNMFMFAMPCTMLYRVQVQQAVQRLSNNIRAVEDEQAFKAGIASPKTIEKVLRDRANTTWNIGVSAALQGLTPPVKKLALGS